MAWNTCEQCVKERSKIIVQGGISRECLLDIAAQHDRTKLILICCRQLLVKGPSLCKHPPEFPHSQPHSLFNTGKANDPHNRLHLSPTDVTLRNAIFRTKQCLIACANIPSADPHTPHLNYQTVFPSPQKWSGHETTLPYAYT